MGRLRVTLYAECLKLEPVERGRRAGARLWLACEKSKLEQEVRNFKVDGKIRWAALATAWEHSRTPDQPERTVAALKAAYAKLCKNLTGVARPNPVSDDSVTIDATSPRGSSAEVLEVLDSAGGHDCHTEASSSEVVSANREVADIHADISSTNDSMGECLLRRIENYLRVAKLNRHRVPIRRPRSEIPSDLLETGNNILSGMIRGIKEPISKGKRYLSELSDAVYAVARAIASTADSLSKSEDSDNPKLTLAEAIELRGSLVSSISIVTNELARRRAKRPGTRATKKYRELAEVDCLRGASDIHRHLRQLKDRLNTTQQRIKVLEESKRRMLARRLGASHVVRDHHDRTTVDMPITSIREYWEPIVGRGKSFRVGRELQSWADDLASSATPERSQVFTEENWRDLFRKVKPWKATGPDGIQGFWWKHLSSARRALIAWCERAMAKPRQMIPSWLCEGRVVLIPKELKGDQSIRGPGDFRPIACLNVSYKILTASMSTRILQSVGDRFPREQIALRKGVWGCTHAQILDQTVIRDAMRHKKELHMLWVDLTKAFDSLSHGSIRWAVKQWGVPSDVRRMLTVLMSLQSVRYYGWVNGRVRRSSRLQIRNGLMQGDTLSPLLFCLAIAPTSHWIRQNVKPYRTQTGSSVRSEGVLELGHILYMDDLKIYTPEREGLEVALDGIVGLFGQLGLELNARKCATRCLNSPGASQVQLDLIPSLGATELYRYLGAEQNTLVCIGDLLDRVEQAAKTVARRLFFSDLTVRQKVNGYNQVVIPKLKYAFSCVIFGAGRLGTLKKRANKFDVDIRKLMEDSKMRFRSSCAARVYVEREAGGLGMKSVEEELDRSIAYSWCYLASNTDLLTSYELAESLRASHKRSLTSDFLKVLAANGIEGQVRRTVMATIIVDGVTFFTPTEAARAISALIRARWSKTHLTAWRSKVVASRVLQEYGQNGEPTGLCVKDSFLWSARGWVGAVVLRNVWAVQEGSLLTRSSAAGRACVPHASGVCRMRCSPGALETAEHIVSSCSHWRTNIMVDRHDDLARVLYASLRKKYNIKAVPNTHVPHCWDEKHVAIHWNDAIWTSEGLAHNRPDILVWDKVSNRIWIIEISVSWFTRVQTQERRKLGKYGVNSTLPEETPVSGFFPGPNLRACLQKDRKCRVDVIPIVVGTCGEVSPNLKDYLRALELPDPEEGLIERLQRAAVQEVNEMGRENIFGLRTSVESPAAKGGGSCRPVTICAVLGVSAPRRVVWVDMPSGRVLLDGGSEVSKHDLTRMNGLTRFPLSLTTI
ncbi:reverse transcriptase [Oesophagostomum dentatum]|uniref:Reverse transcriptase n=1 Tax=Oesophagostomum dentatum TaxID=61180 RepID=A0A0B1SAM8_OESDE|nr:reverse transcriptase [Oesophagostomum dentatum]